MSCARRMHQDKKQLIKEHGVRSARKLQEGEPVLVVDLNGQGQFSSIQEAVDSIQNGPATIQINAGTYIEKVVVPSSLSYITMQGAGMGLTIVQYNLKAADIGTDGFPLTAYNAATVSILSSNFVAKDITFQNTQPPPPPGVEGYQAPALKISGDKAAFYRCAFLGAQDTLCDDEGRHYFEACYLEGSIDFIFGNGRSLYKNCELHSIAEGYGSIAAQDRQSPSENTGFSFVNCKVTGSGPIYLGRAMGPYASIVFAYSHFDGILDPRGWDDWDHDLSKDSTVFFGQYQCDGPGADESHRVSWSHELSDSEVQPYLDLSFIDGSQWVPSSS
ncbi:hypothetical protein KP509_06G019100 [Ceratopteris richardii]|nr:hypothetical protein KP509_06G019100 [Ceratopteris richardii]